MLLQSFRSPSFACSSLCRWVKRFYILSRITKHTTRLITSRRTAGHYAWVFINQEFCRVTCSLSDSICMSPITDLFTLYTSSNRQVLHSSRKYTQQPPIRNNHHCCQLLWNCSQIHCTDEKRADGALKETSVVSCLSRWMYPMTALNDEE